MRILHVVPSYIPAWRYGGPIRSVHGLCKALVSLGHDVHVATTNVDGANSTAVPLCEPVDLEGVKVHYFASPTMRRLFFSPGMRQFLASFVPTVDLVHTHSVFLWPTTAAARSARRVAKPYVLSPRGMLVGDLIRRRSWIAKKAWMAAFERRNVELAAAIHVTSQTEERELFALGLHPRTVFLAPNGVDLPSVAAQPTGQLLDLPDRFVLYLGRISWKKGLDRLVRALALLPDVNLVVAGNDDENYWPEIMRIASDLSISARVRFVGYGTEQRKGELFSRASVFALASYSENFGNSVLEAMSYGLPVVVTPEVGIASVVERYNCGAVTGGEPAPLSQALGRLIFDQDARRQASENASRAAKEFSWQSVALLFDRQYRAIATR